MSSELRNGDMGVAEDDVTLVCTVDKVDRVVVKVVAAVPRGIVEADSGESAASEDKLLEFTSDLL